MSEYKETKYNSMICPYTVTRVVTTYNEYKYDDNGTCVSCTTTEMNKAKFVECEKEHCGAFYNGHCCYSGNK